MKWSEFKNQIDDFIVENKIPADVEIMYIDVSNCYSDLELKYFKSSNMITILE